MDRSAGPSDLALVLSGPLANAIRHIAAGDVAPEFGALDAGPAIPEFVRARAGIAHLAALLARDRHDSTLLNIAVHTWDHALATAPQRPDGALGSTKDGDADDVQTMFIGTQLGLTLLAVRDLPPVDLAERWTDTVLGAASHLERNGNVTFYTNGNVNIGNALLFRIAAELSGSPSRNATAQLALDFALDPPGPQWEEFGLKITLEPRSPDGADGAGFLAEKGQGGTGFDADYTQVALDLAARLYLVGHDPRLVRVMSLLSNSLLPRVDRGAWTLATDSGTRLARDDRTIRLDSGALAVLAFDGCRGDLHADALSLAQATAERTTSDVEKQVEQDYALMGGGPTTMMMTANGSGLHCPPKGGVR